MKPRLKTVTVEPASEAKGLLDLNSTFKWTRGADVQQVWRRYGWQPPSEYRNDYLFKQNRELSVNG